MAAIRAMRNYVIGSLSVAATISTTTLNSAGFAALPDTYSATQYLPLTLQDPLSGEYEIVWVTAHTAGDNNVTVARGKEGKAARAWPQNTQIGCNPTLRDILSWGASGARPADAHLGMHWVDTDTKQELTLTETAGWQAAVGIARAAQVGPRRSGAAIPSTATILEKPGHVTSIATNGAGLCTVTYSVAFPTATIGWVATPTNGIEFNGTFTMDAETASGFTAYAWRHDGLPHTNSTVSFYYVATGY
jgi:hypothetical protein